MTRVSIKTVGCRLNQAETGRIVAEFLQAGYRLVDWGQPCDVAVVHSCAITGEAARTYARHARVARRRAPGALIVMAGCAAAVDPDRLKKMAEADLVFSQKEKFGMPARIGSGRGDASDPAPPERGGLLPRFSATRALVKVQDGCNFHCAYCIVPQARGRPVSRRLDSIADEVRRLTEAGYREMALTGANIGLYCHGRTRLPELLARIESIAGVARMRISSIEISTTEKAVIDFMAQSDKLCRSLHFPVQSGDDRILEAMGRRYRVRDYRERVEYALDRLGRPGLGTDIVVGFPGEDARAFANTLALVNDLPFSNLHVFPFSPRPGTRACAMRPVVADGEKKERVARLLALGEQKKEDFARQWLGREVRALIEKNDGRLARGWTGEYMPAAVVDPGAHANEIRAFVAHAVRDGVLHG